MVTIFSFFDLILFYFLNLCAESWFFKGGLYDFPPERCKNMEREHHWSIKEMVLLRSVLVNISYWKAAISP